MVEIIATYVGLIAISSLVAIYATGVMIVISALLNEGRPLWHIIYLPLALLWPFVLLKRLIAWNLEAETHVKDQ